MIIKELKLESKITGGDEIEYQDLVKLKLKKMRASWQIRPKKVAKEKTKVK